MRDGKIVPLGNDWIPVPELAEVVRRNHDVERMPPVLLELRNVDVVFDGVIQVLRSVNLEVRTGKVTALLGGNGAGKTTTLKAISGLLAVEHGKVTRRADPL